MTGIKKRVERFKRNTDLWIIAMVAPLVSVFMWYIGRVVPDLASAFTWTAFFINLSYVWVIALATRTIVHYLDKSVKWRSKGLKWFIIYVVSIGAYFILQACILVFIENKVDSLLLIIVYTVGAALVTALIFLYFALLNRPVDKANEVREDFGFLDVNTKGKKAMLSITDIALIEVKNGVTHIVDKDHTRYHSLDSLKSIVAKLPAKQFFQVNRFQAMQKGVISKWVSKPNKTIDVYLEQRSDAIVVSRARAGDFRTWFNNEGR